MQKFKTRKGHVKEEEMVVWTKLTPDFMTNESDWENGKIAVHNLNGEVMVSFTHIHIKCYIELSAENIGFF